MSRGRQLVALLAILALGGWLRFTGLSWGLRHTPHWDERVFVENARAMVEEASLDHRYYEYPGLFFYLLAPVFALLPRETLDGPGAYLAARGVIAVFGLLSVTLVYVLGSRLMGPRGALAAALLLAVSPLEIVTSHMVRPDVALASCVLLAMLAFRRVGPGLRGDLLAGAAIGVATAVKFTGLLVVPSYLAARLLAPGPRLRGIVVAGLVAALVAIAFTPYALINAGEYLHGVGIQMGAHYKGRAHPPAYTDQLRFYLGVVPWAFGPLAGLLVAAGLLTLRSQWRSWVVLLAHPLTTLVVLATAELRYERHLVPAAGLLALLAGSAIARLAERRAWLAGLLTGLAAFFPLAASLAYDRGIGQPSTRDRTLDWIAAKVPAGARLLTTLPDIGLDPQRFEVVAATSWEPAGRLLAREVDLVVSGSDDPSRGLTTVTAFRSDDPRGGAPVFLQKTAAQAETQALRPDPRSLSASANAGQLTALVDDRLDSSWQTGGPQRGEEWIEADLGGPRRLVRVELLLGERPALYAQNLHLLVSEEGRAWRRVPAVPARPPVEAQLGDSKSQVLLLDAVEVRRLRIAQVGKRRRPWGAAELRIHVLP